MARTATMTPSGLVPGKFTYSVQNQDGSNFCFGGPVDEATVRQNLRTLGVYVVAGDPDYTNLSEEQIAAALTANGYLTERNEYSGAEFIKMTESGAMYAVQFEGEDGQTETGHVYITYHSQHGFRGEF
jgi:hypothetical protein